MENNLFIHNQKSVQTDHLSTHLSNNNIMLLTQPVTPVKTLVFCSGIPSLSVAAMNKLSNFPSKYIVGCTWNHKEVIVPSALEEILPAH